MKTKNSSGVMSWDKAEQLTEKELDLYLDNLSDEELSVVADDFLDEHQNLMEEVKETKQKAVELIAKNKK